MHHQGEIVLRLERQNECGDHPSQFNRPTDVAEIRARRIRKLSERHEM